MRSHSGGRGEGGGGESVFSKEGGNAVIAVHIIRSAFRAPTCVRARPQL